MALEEVALHDRAAKILEEEQQQALAARSTLLCIPHPGDGVCPTLDQVKKTAAKT
jgi:hypothetical protein